MARELVRTICPYCAVGCDLHVVVEDGQVVGLEYLAEAPVSDGALCSKGNSALGLLDHPDRLRYPQKKVKGRWERITWEEAFDIVAGNLSRIRDQHGPDALGFLCSAKCTNEENYVFQKLARLLGTNNVDHCARLCHSSTLAGLVATFGMGAMTNPFADLANARCIFIIGSNLAENHPVVCRWVLEAKERGAFVIVADPRYTPTAWLADLYLQLKPGTDIALINAMMYTIINEGLHDAAFVARRTTGISGLTRVVEGYKPQDVAGLTGVPAADIVRAARAYAKAPASAIVYCMGVTQHTSGTRIVINCANLAMLCGHVGRPGTGVNPLRGQDNVQGACDMGGLPNVYPGYQKVTDEAVREKFEIAWSPVENLEPGTRNLKLPAQPGLTVTEMIDAAGEGHIKAMYIMGENPVVGDPNSRCVRASLEKLDFLIVQDIFPNETSELAHLLLPAAAWAEKSGSKTTSDRRVQWSFQAVEPPGEARPDWWIVCQIAERLGWGDNFHYGSPEEILSEINQVTPIYGGLTPERVKSTPGGIPWPCPDADHPGTPVLYRRRFEKPEGRGVIIPVGYEPPAEPTDEEYPLVLTTGRMALHYNSGAMSRRSEPLLRREPEVYVAMNGEDAVRIGIADGELVRVATRRGEVTARARVTHTIRPGVVFMPFHFPETNMLTNDALDPQAKIPEYKVAACQVRRVKES